MSMITVDRHELSATASGVADQISRKRVTRPFAPVELLIFQGTPFCNINCRYCYLPDRSNTARMPLHIIRTTCRRLREESLAAHSIAVLWHAGEPLTLPVEYYDQAFSIIEAELGARNIEHAIQSNAMLIDDAWLLLFKKWSVRLGVSLDGPPDFHDRYRVTRAGRPTSLKVLHGLERIRKAGMPLHVICVLTKESIDHPQKLFEFFEGLGVARVNFNVDEIEGSNPISSFGGEDPKPKFHRFLRTYFDLVRTTGSSQVVREYQAGLKFIFDQDLKRRNMEIEPLQILTVGHDGSFATYSPEFYGAHHPQFGRMVFGNVADPTAFTNLLYNETFINVTNSIWRGIELCRQNCQYFEFCHGGSPCNKLGEHGTFEATETIACKFYKQAVADVMVEIMTGS